MRTRSLIARHLPTLRSTDGPMIAGAISTELGLAPRATSGRNTRSTARSGLPRKRFIFRRIRSDSSKLVEHIARSVIIPILSFEPGRSPAPQPIMLFIRNGVRSLTSDEVRDITPSQSGARWLNGPIFHMWRKTLIKFVSSELNFGKKTEMRLPSDNNYGGLKTLRRPRSLFGGIAALIRKNLRQGLEKGVKMIRILPPISNTTASSTTKSISTSSLPIMLSAKSVFSRRRRLGSRPSKSVKWSLSTSEQRSLRL